MTEIDDFQQGPNAKIDTIASFFPSWARYLRRSQQNGAEAYLREVSAALDELPKWAIETACRKLLTTHIPTANIPFKVAGLAKSLAERSEQRRWKRIANGLDVVRCPTCNDEGTVLILDPQTVQQCLETGKPPSFPYTCVAVCNCEAGDKIAEMWSRAGVRAIRYNSKRHIIADRIVGVKEEYEALCGEFLSEREEEGGGYDAT